ncbi:MAG TPA: imidazolonepropionase [Acidimicrobiia bacterium]|nr:imidazolonepropionase [Acidimicrobiia bacterium]
MTLVIDRIGELVTNQPEEGAGPLGIRENAAVAVENGRVVAVGPAGSLEGDQRIDAKGAALLPGFVDSHTHLVFAGDRSSEFVARMAGQPYRAAGINTTVEATRAADDDELRGLARRRLDQARATGTTHVEIKSGYGLSVEHEARSLRLATELTSDTTFLGAHVIPHEYADRPADYLDLVTGPMLEACAQMARWIDVFCEDGAFDEDQSRAVLAAGAAAGLGLRVHANQLGPGPGVRVAVEMGAASADHCTHLADSDLDALSSSDTVATFLPAADYSTRQPYPDARRAIDAGVTVALASNCNPGSSNTTSLPFCLGLAVREMGMTAAEAVWAATVGGATALRREDLGRIRVGTPADLHLLDAPSHTHLIYQPGVALTALTLVAGEVVYRRTGGS